MPSHVPAVTPAKIDLRPKLMIHGEAVTITNFRGSLPDPAETADRLALVRAGRSALQLNDDGLHAAARALTDPAAVARTIKSGLLNEESVGPANLTVAFGHVYLTELLTIVQPRAGAAARAVDPPQIEGCLDDDGAPEAMVVLRFRNEKHLVDQVAQTVRQTRALGRDYAASILTKRVSRPVLVHPARIEFSDGSESFVVLVVRDGLTRVVSSWAALYPDASVDELADAIAGNLLAIKRGRKTDDTETAIRARGRNIILQDLRVRFAQGATEEAPNEDAIRIGQTLTMPAQVVLSVNTVGTPGVGIEDQFDDAVQALVASVHGEFQPWEASASDAAAILRALPRVVHDKLLDKDVARLATGSLPVSQLPDVFGDEGIPPTALWRAVYLVAWLCHDVEFAAIKRHLRDLLGVSRIENKAYIGHLMTLIDLPWRHAKQDTRTQALRAWKNGGPIPHELLGVDWDPVPTSDFTTLVPLAIAGDLNAKYTLQVAGGIALVTDKLLLSNTGSALAGEQVPFRSNVNDVVTGLGSRDAGLWLLAHAANAFRDRQRAVNSYTAQEMLRTSPAQGSYVVPMPDPTNPQAVKVDNAGRPEHLTPYTVVFESNPARAAAEVEKKKASKPRQPTETSAARAVRLRGNVRTALKAGIGDLEALIALGNSDMSLQPILADAATWQELVADIGRINGLLYANMPAAPALAVGVPSDDDADEFNDAVGEGVLA